MLISSSTCTLTTSIPYILLESVEIDMYVQTWIALVTILNKVSPFLLIVKWGSVAHCIRNSCSGWVGPVVAGSCSSGWWVHWVTRAANTKQQVGGWEFLN